MSFSDENLLQSALAGDGGSFGELVTRWERKIYGFIYRYVGDREEARDLTQETFVKAYKNLGRLSDHRRFSSWLYKIALNECRMRFRRRRWDTVPLPESVEAPLTKADDPTPEQALASKEKVQLLREALLKLPEEQKTVILMKEYQGLKFREIAQILDLPLSTAKSRMYLGLKTLRRLMEKRL